MTEFIRKFLQLNDRIATIILDHCFFGTQKFDVQELELIEDNERLGLILRGQDIFVHKNKLKSMELNDNFVMFADDKLKILIK